MQDPETLPELLHDLWAIKVFITVGSIIGFIIAGLYIWTAQKTYKVTMIAGSVPSISMQTIPNSTQTNALRPLRNDNTASLSQMHQNMYRTMFRSPRVAGMIIKVPERIKALSYDKKYGLFSINPTSWSDNDLSSYFHKKIRISPVQNTNDLIEISYSHPNPDFAGNFLLQLHALTDESIRNDHKKLINDRRAYITKALGQALNIDHKKALGQLLIDLEREAIMVNSDRSFAMRIIDPPSSSANPFHPRSKIILLMFVLSGAFIGILTGFAKKAF